MKAAGLNAKKNGRWDAAYDSPSRATVPSDFQAALDANPRATAFFKIDPRSFCRAIKKGTTAASSPPYYSDSLAGLVAADFACMFLPPE
jgi:hypothetical protein